MAVSTTKYRVDGMDCAACASKIETAVKRVSGVQDASASFTAGTLKVTHDESAKSDAISGAVRKVGYKVIGKDAPAAPAPKHDHGAHDHDHDHDHDHNHPHDHDHDHDHGDHKHEKAAAKDEGSAHDHDHFDMGAGPWWKSSKAIIAGATAVALAAAYLLNLAVPAVGHWAYLAALAVGLIPIASRAFRGATSGTPFSIETLMTIAAVGAVIIGATQEAATVVLLFLVGELLEGIAARRARASIQSLTDLVPKTAQVEENGKTREIQAADLKVGMMLMVRPGDRIAADGRIVEGSSAIDEAPVTGESVPKRKSKGDDVFAGTINTDAVLKIEVTAAAADNTIARVVRLVEEAQESKAPTERFIDRFSRYYTPGVLVVGALVAILPPLLLGQSWNEWVYKGLAILLIGCPCALVISTPAAIAAGLSNGARRGMLLKGGAVLEELRFINTVALDKTGTLTQGKPVVTDIVTVSGTSNDLLAMAAAVETGSNHPLAVAILAKAKDEKLDVPSASDAKAIAGKGVTGRVNGKDVLIASPKVAAESKGLGDLEARINAMNDEGKTVSVVLVNGKPVGIIAMRDEPRADAKAGLEALKAAGIQTIMLTGDNERTASAIGRSLGIEVRAGLLPQDKQRIVKELQGKSRVVAKVGDGINDAPALAAANIGIAMGGGTDVALETADAAVLHGRVADIAGMVQLSKTVMQNIKQNITVSLGLKAVFLVTTIAGITGLWPAILADTGATVVVTANALRLLKIKS